MLLPIWVDWQCALLFVRFQPVRSKRVSFVPHQQHIQRVGYRMLLVAEDVRNGAQSFG